MEKSLKKGCRAVIVGFPHEPNNGIEVTIGGFLGRVVDSDGLAYEGERWLIDVDVDEVIKRLPSNELIVVGLINHVNAKYLRRLDEYDGNQTVSWESMKDLFVPEGINAY